MKPSKSKTAGPNTSTSSSQGFPSPGTSQACMLVTFLSPELSLKTFKLYFQRTFLPTRVLFCLYLPVWRWRGALPARWYLSTGTEMFFRASERARSSSTVSSEIRRNRL